jgi:hypothetical protein
LSVAARRGANVPACLVHCTSFGVTNKRTSVVAIPSA